MHRPDRSSSSRPAAGRRLGARSRKLQGPGASRHAAVRRPVAEDEDARPGPTAGQPGFLGLAHAAVQAQRRRHGGMVARAASRWTSSADRTPLLERLRPPPPRGRRQRRARRGSTPITQQAFGILTSSQLADALDLEREDRAHPRPLRPRLDPKPAGYGDAGPLHERLLPRRPPAGRGRRPRRHAGLRPLGLARPAARHQLRERPPPPARCSTRA